MAGPATILRDIHRLRRHARDLRAEIERGPRLLKGQQTKVARQEDVVREAQDRLKRLKVTCHDSSRDPSATTPCQGFTNRDRTRAPAAQSSTNQGDTARRSGAGGA